MGAKYCVIFDINQTQSTDRSLVARYRWRNENEGNNLDRKREERMRGDG